jgi:hypothetical protein
VLVPALAVALAALPGVVAPLPPGATLPIRRGASERRLEEVAA